jgi:phosphoglycerate dehydrogenase-like enzyme
MRAAVRLPRTIPADLRTALAERCGPPEGRPAAGPRIAVTAAVHGTLFDRLPDLRMRARQDAGLERIDLAPAAGRGIGVACAPGVMTKDMADAAVGRRHGAARLITEDDRFDRAGRWRREGTRLGTRLRRKAAGNVGPGSHGASLEHATRAAFIARRIEDLEAFAAGHDILDAAAAAG